MRHPIRKSRGGPRRGIALLAVLVVVAVLALAAYRFSDLMQGEAQAADSYTKAVQARTLAESGIHYTAAMLAADPTGQSTLNGNPYDNASAFQGILVQDSDQARQRGRFSIVSPLDPDSAAAGGSQAFRYGVTDETGKLNINALFKLDSSGQILYNALMQLPNMTDDVANSIIDWIDPDSTPRNNGAEDEYYATLNPPYHAKNAPLDSIDELLYVKGVTPELLYGNDKNRNGILDPDEDDGSGQLNLGWAAYLTVYSREQNVDSQGNPRIYVNNQDLNSLYSQLSTALGEDLANFIVAYRQYGPASGGPGGGGPGGGAAGAAPAGGGAAGAKPAGGGAAPAGGVSAPAGAKPAGAAAAPAGKAPTTGDGDADDGSTAAKSAAAKPAAGAAGAGAGSRGLGSAAAGPQPRLTRATLGDIQKPQRNRPQSISSLYQLVNAQVSIPGANPQDPPTIYTSPMSDPSSIRQYLPMVLDMLTTSRDSSLPARVNINTAPSAVLSALPNLDPVTVQAILNGRPSLDATDPPDPIYQTPAWLITEAGLSPQTLQSLEKYVTGRSQVYRMQAVGHFDGGGPTARIEVVIDLNAGRPRIVYYRDLTGLGKAFNLTINQ
jgi:type II secretory pathway component PulK